MSSSRVADRPGAVERRLPPQPSSVCEARRMVRELLAGECGEELVQTAELLVSEVVTNALLHAGTPIDVAAGLDEDGLRVEVGDGSPHLPVRRRYAATSGTGRGMMMLEQLVDDWGVSRDQRGKTVWFELGRGGDSEEGSVSLRTTGRQAPAGRTLEVELANMPLLLHAAWQEHAEALLREYLLVNLDGDGDDDPIQVHAEATDAIAVLEEHVPRAHVDVEPDRLMADATEPRVSAAALRVPVPVGAVPHFDTLDKAIEEALALSHQGLVLTPPTQPEIRGFRHWLCGEVRRQAAGAQPRPWSMSHAPRVQPTLTLEWDPVTVTGAADARVAADESSRILAVSPALLDLLGYDRAEELVGQRIVAMIPERFRQAHVAGFTMYLLVGRGPLLGAAVTVPAVRRDGGEVTVAMTVTVEQVAEGRQVFVAEMAAVAG